MNLRGVHTPSAAASDRAKFEALRLQHLQTVQNALLQWSPSWPADLLLADMLHRVQVAVLRSSLLESIRSAR